MHVTCQVFDKPHFCHENSEVGSVAKINSHFITPKHCIVCSACNAVVVLRGRRRGGGGGGGGGEKERLTLALSSKICIPVVTHNTVTSLNP